MTDQQKLDSIDAACKALAGAEQTLGALAGKLKNSTTEMSVDEDILKAIQAIESAKIVTAKAWEAAFRDRRSLKHQLSAKMVLM